MAAKYITDKVAVGVNFFHGQQITGDSGSGAVLGSFEGRATAIGPELNATLALGGIPVFVNMKYMMELEVQNRLKGNAGWLTVTMPLGGQNP